MRNLARNHAPLQVCAVFVLVSASEAETRTLSTSVSMQPYLIFVISFTQAAFSNTKLYTRKLTKNTTKH